MCLINIFCLWQLAWQFPVTTHNKATRRQQRECKAKQRQVQNQAVHMFLANFFVQPTQALWLHHNIPYPLPPLIPSATGPYCSSLASLLQSHARTLARSLMPLARALSRFFSFALLTSRSQPASKPGTWQPHVRSRALPLRCTTLNYTKHLT